MLNGLVLITCIFLKSSAQVTWVSDYLQTLRVYFMRLLWYFIQKRAWPGLVPGLNLCRHHSGRVDKALTLLQGGEIFRGEGSRLDIVKLGWSREGSRDTIERANTRASVWLDIYHQIYVILYSSPWRLPIPRLHN